MTSRDPGAHELAPGRHDGRVLRARGGVYEVELGPGTVLDAALRGRLKREQRTGQGVVAGDRVTVEVHDDGSATIEAVANRHSQLARRAPGRNVRQAKVIAANIDQVVVVFAAAHPEPRLRMLDRFLVLAEANGLAAVVVVNKMDLDPGEASARFAPYATAGYDVLHTSAVTGLGLDALHGKLCGRLSVLTGPSGVGKSRLLNSIQPALNRAIGEVSEAVGKGRHTTVTAELIPLDCGGYVADTPGLRELGLWGVPTELLRDCFPEFLEPAGQCRFAGSCTHTHEPDCAVRAAVDAGTVNPDRYSSYCAMLEAEAGTGV